MMKRIIVDQNDNEIGAKERHELLPEDIYRVSALWLKNSKEEVLLAKRALSLRNDPGKWASAVAGTVEMGETYDINIVKEIEEEIGLRDLILRRGPKIYRNGEKRKYFCQWYLATVDVDAADIDFEKKEVAAVRWITLADLSREVVADPASFTSTPKGWLERIRTFGLPPNPPEFILKPGQRDYTNVPDPETLNCVISSGDRILLVKRNSKMKTYPGYWSTVTGYLDDEKSPIEKAKEELWEEAAIGDDRIISFREAPMIPLEDKALGRVWRTHPVLAEIRGRGLILDWEAEDARWIKPEEVHNYKVVPGFERVLGSFFKI